MKLQDLTGKTFGKLTVIERAENHVSKNGNRRPAWLCRCICGNEVVVMGLNLTRGHTVSCGCARKEGRDRLVRDISGQRFGQLVAIKRIDTILNGSKWLFRCDCGNEKEMLLQNVVSGKSKTCGKCKPNLEKELTQSGIKGVRFDLVGRRFDRLVAKERFIDGNIVKYLCKCDCGNECIKTTYSLIYQPTNSCGCLHKESIKKLDLFGQRFNHLVVIGKAETRYRKLHWLCRCDCGNMTIVSSSGLKTGHTQSCGCFKDEVASDTHFEDLSGKKYGMLYVVKRVHNSRRGEVQYLCKCECGKEKVIRGIHIKNGNTRSCGCSVQPLGELAICGILDEYEVDYDTQVRFVDLTGIGNKQLSYDFGIYNGSGRLVALVEYQGMQHYQPIEFFGGEDSYEKQQLHDELKKDYAQKMLGVPLLEVPYSARTQEEIRDIIALFLKNHLSEEYSQL